MIEPACPAAHLIWAAFSAASDNCSSVMDLTSEQQAMLKKYHQALDTWLASNDNPTAIAYDAALDACLDAGFDPSHHPAS